jgi:hypothetical protein
MSTNQIPITLTNNSKLTTIFVSESRGDGITINQGTAIEPGETAQIGIWIPYAKSNYGWIYLGRNQSSNDFQVYFEWYTSGPSYRQEFGRYDSSSDGGNPNPKPLPTGVGSAEHLGSEWGSEYRYVYDDTFKHKSRLTSPASGPDVWEHLEHSDWQPLTTTTNGSSCVLSVDRVYANVKLEIQKNCGRNFRMRVYTAPGHTLDPNYHPIDIYDTQPGVFEFRLPEGDSEWAYETDGNYLNADGSEGESVPDPDFTIKRRGG